MQPSGLGKEGGGAHSFLLFGIKQKKLKQDSDWFKHSWSNGDVNQNCDVSSGAE